MKVLVIPLASMLHGVDYCSRLYGFIEDCVREYRDVELYDIVSREAPSIDYSAYDIIVLVHLTGGTSWVAREIAVKSRKPVVLVAHSRHNSLASSLSARAWIRERGLSARLLYVDELKDFCKLFKPLYSGVEARDYLRNLRVLEVNVDGRLSEKARVFMEAIGASVEPVSFEEIRRVGWGRDVSDMIDGLYSVFSKQIDFSSADRGTLYDALRVYTGLKRVLEEYNCNAASIDCFPFVVKYHVTPCIAVAMLNNEGIPCACENDFYSLTLLVLSQQLTGYPGWIANPSGLTSEGYVRFAHCTIAPKLCRKAYLMTHFETSYPYAVACSIAFDKLLALRLSLDYRELHVYKSLNKGSGYLEEGFCRTQLVVDMGSSGGYRFIESAVGNHHVFIPWSEGVASSLETLSWIMGWRLVVHN